MENASWGSTQMATQIKMQYDNAFGAAWHVRLFAGFYSLWSKSQNIAR